ncbi:YbaK/EbsC family protein [Patescibacteria group bacterium]
MSQKDSLDPISQKVQDALNRLNIESRIIKLKKPARTALEAAEALNCQLGQIAKSLVFRGKETQKPFLLIVSGVNHVSEPGMNHRLGEAIEIANPNYVQEKTGFAIGGVPPLGHIQPIITFLDQDLFRHQEIWAAGGTPQTVFKITPKQLEQFTQGEIVKIV